jgi:hypothetical protein
MKLEDIFNTKITSEIIDTTYKGFPASIAREIIEDLKEVYGSQALEKLKYILEERYKDKMTCNYYDCGWCYAPNDIKTNATQGECTFPENCPYLKSQMTNQANCNHRTPPKHHVDYLDERMVIVNGVSYTREKPTPIVIQKDENTIIVGGVKYQKMQTLTIYEFLVQCEYGELNPPYFDFDKKIEIENYAENFLNYLYEYCDVIEEDDNKLVVSISKKQMVMPND